MSVGISGRNLDLLMVSVGEATRAPAVVPSHRRWLVRECHHPLGDALVGLRVLRRELLFFVAGQVDLQIGVLRERPRIVNDGWIRLKRRGFLDGRLHRRSRAGEDEPLAVLGHDHACEPISLMNASDNNWFGHPASWHPCA